MGEQSEGPEAVVEPHDDDAVRGEVDPLEQRARARARREATPVDPDHDRSPGVVERGRPHVQAQAVLVPPCRIAREAESGNRRRLGRNGTPRGGVPHALPGRNRRCLPPAGVGPAGVGIRDAPEYPPQAGLLAPKQTPGRARYLLHLPVPPQKPGRPLYQDAPERPTEPAGVKVATPPPEEISRGWR